ncbi:MAG: 50S ribosomal protein L21 [Candidatus Portnoybacteria bacterium CG10_big_fil_rev_8_21_14_0_10_38_18]|uniref:Large ribosomal subunit protein bL21 n=1 Tax=Candidatus Portnoybacteria bacterium CG10_big_fil_rev_8_21_14_0_10_38_18 TaxID=1974813 RepID=A0A2M8KCW5_9BACT|nr:MAG: 50S ribosomal protein L21 [Candidatus Portnoybacteria bacterium CG10_big_fil_rev_8_21_14_0_10_38_18]
MLAVIKTGGKQYLVSPKQKIKIEKIEGKEDDEVNFTEVLLLEKNKKLEIGKPIIKNAKVVGKILKQGKGKKIIVFKYKAKKREQTKKGHRQTFTEVEIKDILLSSQ